MFNQVKGEMLKVGVNKVIQFVSDSGPDAAKCRRLLREEFDHIVAVPCTSHSLDLLIEDVLDLPFFQG